MFDRVLALLASAWKPGPYRAGSPEGHERRDLPRHPHGLEVTCRPVGGVGDLPRLPAVVQDVSIGGIGLLLSQPQDLGGLLSISWPRPIPGIPPTLTVRVVRVTPQSGGLWRLGCTFGTELTEPQLEAILDALR